MSSFQFFHRLRDYLETYKINNSLARTEKLKIVRSASNFTLRDGRLFYTDPSHCSMRLVVMSEEEKMAVLNECHIQQGTDKHLGYRSTRDRVVARYYWRSIVKDVTDWVKCCHSCQLNEPMKIAAPVKPPIKVKETQSVFGMDPIYPLQETTRKKRYRQADRPPQSPLVRHVACQTDPLHKRKAKLLPECPRVRHMGSQTDSLHRTVSTQLSLKLQQHNSGTRKFLSRKNRRLSTTTGPLRTPKVFLMIETPGKLNRPARTQSHLNLKEEEEKEVASVTVTI